MKGFISLDGYDKMTCKNATLFFLIIFHRMLLSRTIIEMMMKAKYWSLEIEIFLPNYRVLEICIYKIWTLFSFLTLYCNYLPLWMLKTTFHQVRLSTSLLDCVSLRAIWPLGLQQGPRLWPSRTKNLTINPIKTYPMIILKHRSLRTAQW